MKYNIELQETAYLSMEVEAENSKEAREIALHKGIDSNDWESNGIEIVLVTKN